MQVGTPSDKYLTNEKGDSMNKVGTCGPGSGSQGPWIEGDHHSIGVGGGAPANGGDGNQSLRKPNVKGTPVKNVNSGDL